ncbi:MAG: peptidoglycan DD-metalloendopeptidase family protein [Pseudoflavonifractor sp.]
MKKPSLERLGDFMAGKGFYIVLFFCVAAIGISGYYLFASVAGGPSADVAGPAKVVVTPAPTPPPAVLPVRPSVPPAAKPSAQPAGTPKPVATAKPKPKPVPTATVFTWPVKGEVLDAFSPDRQRYDTTMGDWRTHAGMDIAAAQGTQVKAMAGGSVEAVLQDFLMDTVVTIDHGDGLKSSYANLAEQPNVKAGDPVSAGDVIGSVGCSAKAESALAPHLHLELHKAETAVNPLDYLPEMR